MSTLTAFAQPLAEQRSSSPVTCPASCHGQPEGNAALLESMAGRQPDTSWLDGIDGAGSAWSDGGLAFLSGSVDTGTQETGGFGSRGELSAASLTEELDSARLSCASGKVSWATSTAEVGASASVLECALDGRRPDSEVQDPLLVRAGLGMGVGSAVRLQRTDQDGDGRPECNFGFDLGPVSADLMSETLCPQPWWAGE